MTRRAAVRTLAFVTIAAATIQCSESTAPRPRPLDNSIGVIVSGLVAPHPGTPAAQGAPSVPTTGLAYVSLPPSSVPDGITATVTNHATGVVVSAAMQNGGFDPVAIGANVGDTLGVDITTSSPGTVHHALLVVAARRAPRIVRTNPPSGGRDVPLNSTMVVVFSVPIDPATLTPGVGLRVGDTVSVSGGVAFADPQQVSVAFQPGAQLAPLTTYQFVVTQAIRDLNGIALDSAAVVTFTTGTAIAPPTSPIIAFHSNHGIEEIGADGSGRAVLIADSTAFQPAWSPDGARLAFTRFTDGRNACEIYTVRADGSDERKITTPDRATGLSTWCAYFPAWSPDGSKIAFAAGPSGCAVAPYCWSFPGFIYVVNTDGSNERQLFTRLSLPPPQYPNFWYVSLTTPRWSPDGSMIAFTGDATNGGDDLWWAYIGTAAGSGARRLTDAGLEGPTWSPAGSPLGGGGWEGITLLNLDGSIAAVLTQFGWDVDPAWSPDGAHLVFTRWGVDSSDLFMINRNGTGLRRLTTTGDASHPTWRSATPLPLPQP